LQFGVDGFRVEGRARRDAMRTSGLSVFAVFVATLVFPFGATALITVGALDTSYTAVEIELVGDLAYVAAASAGLRIIDISNPAAPVEVGAFDFPGGGNEAFDVAVEGGLAYVAAFFSGLRIFDVSNPAAPVEVGSLNFPDFVRGVAVADDLAYVAERFSLHIIDVSNPAAPVEVGAIGVFDAKKVEVVGGLAYVLASASLRIIDVSNPAAPVEVGTAGLGAGGNAFELVGDLAYTVDTFGLKIIDVSNPAAPVRVGALRGKANDVVLVGDLAYVSDNFSGLRVIDVSNPAAPVALGGTLSTPGQTVAVAGGGGLAYVGTSRGLVVMDVTNPAAPVQLSVVDSPGEDYWRAVEVVGELAYVAAPNIRIFDVTNPAAPVEIGDLGIGIDFGVEFDVVGGFAYVGTFRLVEDVCDVCRLHIIDASNPAAPVEVGALDIPGLAPAPPGWTRNRPYGGRFGVEVVGDLAYVAAFHLGLRIIDVTNPAAPVELGALDTFEARAVAVVGDLAYLADGRAGLRIIDVTNPTAPVEVGALDTAEDARRVAVVGDLAYVADEGFGLRIIDVSNPAAPVEVSALSAGRTLDVEVVDGFAYLASGAVVVIDVSNPAALVEVGRFNLGGTTQDVEVVDGLTYVVVFRTGFRIIDFGPEYVGNIQIEIDIKPGSDPNSINPTIEGDFPVAIVGSDSFDVVDVDVSTLAFGPSDAPFDHSHGPHFEDLDGSGFTDLMSHFRIEETGIAFGDMMACLSGETLDGEPFVGCDALRTVPDMDGDNLLDVEEEAIGTHPLRSDTDGDGFDDGEEVLVMGTDPLDPLDPTPVPEPTSWLMLVAGTALLGVLYRRRVRGMRFG
jgi:hypothetical protein